MHQNEYKHLTKFVKSVFKTHDNTELCYSDAECKLFFESIKQNPLSKKHFYLAIYLPTNEIFFQHHLSAFFGLNQPATLLDFFEQVHPDYLDAFLHWAKSVYLAAAELCDSLMVLEGSYKITLPLRNADGVYYWVLQEGYVLQLDKHKQMISQFNTYTIIGKYEAPQELFGWISTDSGIDAEKNAVLKRFYNQISNFRISKREKELYEKLRTEPNLAYKTIAMEWGVSEDNVKKQAKSIIEKAKTAFPYFFNKYEKATLKSVVSYLMQLDFEV